MTPRRPVYVRPTPRQRELIAALVATGSLREAAAAIGVTYGSANQLLVAARARSGLSTEQLCYFGALDGWITPHKREYRNAPTPV